LQRLTSPAEVHRRLDHNSTAVNVAPIDASIDDGVEREASG